MFWLKKGSFLKISIGAGMVPNGAHLYRSYGTHGQGHLICVLVIPFYCLGGGSALSLMREAKGRSGSKAMRWGGVWYGSPDVSPLVS